MPDRLIYLGDRVIGSHRVYNRWELEHPRDVDPESSNVELLAIRTEWGSRRHLSNTTRPPGPSPPTSPPQLHPNTTTLLVATPADEHLHPTTTTAVAATIFTMHHHQLQHHCGSATVILTTTSSSTCPHPPPDPPQTPPPSPAPISPPRHHLQPVATSTQSPWLSRAFDSRRVVAIIREMVSG
ncbi:hypothetical protein Tco_0731784 [Tanacetum coccineum]